MAQFVERRVLHTCLFGAGFESSEKMANTPAFGVGEDPSGATRAFFKSAVAASEKNAQSGLALSIAASRMRPFSSPTLIRMLWL